MTPRPLLVYPALFAASFVLTWSLALPGRAPAVSGNVAPVSLRAASSREVATSSAESKTASEPKDAARAPIAEPLPAIAPAAFTVDEPVSYEGQQLDREIRELGEVLQTAEEPSRRITAILQLQSISIRQGDAQGRFRELLRLATTDADATVAQTARSAYQQLSTGTH